MAKRTCSDPECDESARVRGMCQKHYQRWYRAIAPGAKLPPPPPRPQMPPHPAFIDRTGQRYGRLLVIRRGERRPTGANQHTYWLCQCDCGNEVEVYLSGETTTSCGCKRRKAGLATGAARNVVLRGYIGAARRRGLCWELAESDFDRITAQACFYCGIQPSTVARKKKSTFTYNGIDRKHNDIGYTPENAVPCCSVCNYAKKAMSFDAFMAWIARLTEYHFFHPDVMPSRLLRDARKPA
jgi:hypothetical protein